MVGIIVGSIVAIAIIVTVVVLILRSRGGSGGVRDLQRLADIRGWHFSHSDDSPDTYGLSGESMLRGTDGSSLDWRMDWRLGTTRSNGKDRTEFKCTDINLPHGWVFVDPRALAAEIKARQRMGGKADEPGQPVRKVAWKEAQSVSHEVSISTPDFLAHYMVTATAKDSVVKRLVNAVVQKAMLSMHGMGNVSIRMGADGVVIVASPAIYSVERVEQLIKLGEMIVSNVALQSTAEVSMR